MKLREKLERESRARYAKMDPGKKLMMAVELSDEVYEFAKIVKKAGKVAKTSKSR